MQKILITGASGFIGINLVNSLDVQFFNVSPFSRKNGFDYNLIDCNYLNDEGITSIVHLAGKAHDLKNISNVQDYFNVNTDLTIRIFNAFLKSNATKFIFFSSVKSVKDHLDGILTEETIPTPTTPYGKSKLAAENYILSKSGVLNKQIFILRPSMIHGPGNKGNLNLLYNIVKKGVPWPLGAFENKRSFCSIENLCFVIQELIDNENIPSGLYNIADDEPLSTNELIKLIARSQGKKSNILHLPKNLITIISKLGDLIKLPLNTERLHKLTEFYVVSNSKIQQAIGKSLPVSSREGLIKTLKSFNKKAK